MPLRINKDLMGEYSKIIFVPYTTARNLKCKDDSPGHPRKVLLWNLKQDGVPMEERAGICFICKKLYVILSKEN